MKGGERVVIKELPTSNELVANLIDDYANLQRIIKAKEPIKEAEYQLKLIQAKLETMGVPTTTLELTD